MEQTTRPNYTPLYENGQRVEIRGMAATSIKNQFYSVSVCDRCHAKVAWAKSTKTGKWYVCETAEYSTAEAGNHRFRAVPYRYHDCQTHLDQAAKLQEIFEPRQPNVMDEWQDRKDNPEKYATIDALIARSVLDWCNNETCSDTVTTPNEMGYCNACLSEMEPA